MEQMIKILEDIRKNPCIYLGQKSVVLLYAFISGYAVCQSRTTGIYPSDFSRFEIFVKAKYHLDQLETTHNWACVVRFFSTSDAEAFDTFYNLLDEYRLVSCL